MKRNQKGQFSPTPRYCETDLDKSLSAGVGDLKRFFDKGDTDEDIARQYSAKELVALLRYNQNRIQDDR